MKTIFRFSIEWGPNPSPVPLSDGQYRDRDGFVRLVPVPGGRFEQFLRYRYAKEAFESLGLTYERF